MLRKKFIVGITVGLIVGTWFYSNFKSRDEQDKRTLLERSYIGHLTDVFKNVDSVALKTGEVVKVVPGTRYGYYDMDNMVPIYGVKRCDKEYDPLVVGVVAGPAPAFTFIRTTGAVTASQEVQPGELVAVVRAGIFSTCNVDGTDAKIEPGDLLTSSSKAGFAKKAVNPTAGTIIGKALESCGHGQKSIAVLVSGGQ